MIQQMKGKWKARRGLYLPNCAKAKLLLDELKRTGCRVFLQWVPRERNEEADALSKLALEDVLNEDSARREA